MKSKEKNSAYLKKNQEITRNLDVNRKDKMKEIQRNKSKCQSKNLKFCQTTIQGS